MLELQQCVWTGLETLTRPSLSLSMEVLHCLVLQFFNECLLFVEIQSGTFTDMLVFAPDVNSSCIDFPVMDDDIALEDPEEFIWMLVPIPIPRVELDINTTRIVIIDDDRKFIQIALKLLLELRWY